MIFKAIEYLLLGKNAIIFVAHNSFEYYSFNNKLKLYSVTYKIKGNVKHHSEDLYSIRIQHSF